MAHIADFCTQNGLCPGHGQLVQVKDSFLGEMEAGLSAGSGSLCMLPAYIDPGRQADYSKKVIVIDAGGTNLRVGLVGFSPEPAVEYFENYPMLGTQGELEVDDFYGKLAEYVAPVAGKADHMGICFSFPAEILPNRDARVLYLTKEVRVRGIDGTLLGERLCDALKKRGLPHKKQVAVINDTVAALLGGMVGNGGRVFDSHAALILGTGTNCAYIEKNANIGKDAALSATPGSNIVNMESGGFGLAPRSPIDMAFDADTVNPGEQTFEKMISGAYQGGLLLRYLLAAVEAGCFSPVFAQKASALTGLSGKQIDQFCFFPYGDNLLASMCGEDDRDALYTLMDAFYDRIALLVTGNIAAILEKTGAGSRQCKPACVCAEGTTFYKSKLFRPRLDRYMDSYVRRELGRHCEFIQVENSTILGTAAAGLLG